MVIGTPSWYLYDTYSGGGTLLKLTIDVPEIDNEPDGIQLGLYWTENITKTLWDRAQPWQIQPLSNLHEVIADLVPDFKHKLKRNRGKDSISGVVGFIGGRDNKSGAMYQRKARKNSDFHFDVENSVVVATGSVGSVMYRDEISPDFNICLAMGFEFCY